MSGATTPTSTWETQVEVRQVATGRRADLFRAIEAVDEWQHRHRPGPHPLLYPVRLVWDAVWCLPCAWVDAQWTGLGVWKTLRLDHRTATGAELQDLIRKVTRRKATP